VAKGDTISIDVWQFVRIMVALEKGGRRGGQPGGAYATWRSTWRELDGRLETLGKSDPAAYSDLMMEQQVVLEGATPRILKEVVTAINGVVREMSESLDRATGDPRHQTDLRFERKALKALARRLSPKRPRTGGGGQANQ
jgi:hypothetical protein